MFARNTGWGLLASLVTAPAALGVSVLLARWLDPDTNGQVQAALSLLTVLGFGAQLGTVAATIHRVRRAGQPAAKAVVTGLVSVTLTGGAVVAVLALLHGPLQARVLVGLPTLATGLLLAAVVPLLWMNVLAGMARALDRFADSALADASHQLGRLVLLAGAAWVLPASATVALAAVLGAQLLATGAVATRVLARTGLAATDAGELKATASFGARTYLHTLTGQIHERVDLFLLAALHGDATEIATYAVAVGVVNRIRVLPLAMSSALYPEVASLADADGARLAARACRQATGLSVLSGLALAVVARPLVPWIWGETYAASVLPLWILLPGTVAFSVYLILGRYFQAVDRQGINIAAQGVGVVVNVVLNLFLIPRYGAAGAALASLVSYSLQATWVTVAFVR